MEQEPFTQRSRASQQSLDDLHASLVCEQRGVSGLPHMWFVQKPSQQFDSRLACCAGLLART